MSMWQYSTFCCDTSDWPSQIKPLLYCYVFPSNTAEIRHTLVRIMRAALTLTPVCCQDLLSDHKQQTFIITHSASQRAQRWSSSIWKYDTAYCYTSICSHILGRLKGLFIQKGIFCHCLLTLWRFKTHMIVFLLWNTKGFIYSRISKMKEEYPWFSGHTKLWLDANTVWLLLQCYN